MTAALRDDSVVDLEEWRRRRFAPPRTAHANLSRATRARLGALQLDGRLGAGAADGLRRRTLGTLAAEWFAWGVAIVGAIVVVAWQVRERLL
jgi:hypothetical protein